MYSQVNIRVVGLLSLVWIGLAGCGVWPVMTEENGRRPLAMGKSDQVISPWAARPVHLSEEYGLAYRQAVEGQIMNPSAAENLEPIPGAADPKAIQFSMTRYQLMFENPPFSDLKLTRGGGSSGGGGAKSPKAGSGGAKK